MFNRALLSAVAVCFAVAGCDSNKPAEPPKPKAAAAVVPLPAEKAAASGYPDAKPAQVADAKKAASSLKGCKAGQCKVELTVTGEGDPNCNIAKSRDPLPVWKQNKNDTLRWIINTNGWEFANDGIKFSDAQFTGAGHDGAKHKFKVKDANTDTAEKAYPYAIKLVNAKTRKTCTKDPSVVNGVDSAEN